MDFRVLSADSGPMANFKATRHVDDALKKGGSKPCKDISDWLTRVDAKFDIFILPPEIQNGSMNSVSDSGGDSGSDATRNYARSGKRWLERPTVFWNPTCSVKIYSDVKGTKPKGVTDWTRMQLREIPPGEETLVYRRVGNKYAPFLDEVVILAAEVVLDPWMVLFHELGHMKQYFTLAEQLNLSAHAPALERAWAAKAFSPASCEPENLDLHENPITKFHCAGQFRERYYHDGFHINNTDRNYLKNGINTTLDFTSPHDNFIFVNQAKRANFYKMAEKLPRLKTPNQAAGFYWKI